MVEGYDEERSFGSPPSYAPHATDHFMTSGKGEYTAVSIDDASSAPGDPHTEESEIDALGLTLQDGVYCGLDSEVLDSSALYRLVTARLSAPQVYLKVTGLQTSKPQELFSFTVPLPKMTHNLATIYCKADDCPSMRGRPLKSILHHEERIKRLRRCAETWTLQYSREDQAEVIDPTSGDIVAAPTSSTQHWNARRKRSMVPPWVALEGIPANDWQKEPDADKPRQILRSFLDASSTHWSRWLIIGQCTYGWDMSLIEEELNKMVPTDSALDRLTVEMVDLAPSTIVRIFANSRIEQLYAIGQLIPFWLFTIPFTVLGAAIPLLLLFGASGRLIKWLCIISVPTTLGAILHDVLRCKESVDDTVGIAWALLRWIKTDLPPSLSRAEALEALRRSRLSDAVPNAQGVKLRRGTDAWYNLSGMGEKEWLCVYGKYIGQAIKNRTNGNLDNLYDVILQANLEPQDDD